MYTYSTSHSNGNVIVAVVTGGCWLPAADCASPKENA